MRALVVAVCASLAAFAGPLPAAPRTWTDRDGRTVEAEFIRADGETVFIRRTDGREFALPRARLSAADLSFVDGAPTGPSASAAPAWIEALNLGLGLPLFADAELWDDDPTTVAARLRLQPESVTPGAESWRTYARPAVPVLGVPAYVFALRAEDGRVRASR